jgi:hypothetical protein
MDAMGERLRHIIASSGVVLWLAYPFAFTSGGIIRWNARCSGREFSREFDDCFNDALPVVELFVPIITIALAYPFARFAFSMFSPESTDRRLAWRLAASGGGKEYFPGFQITACVGILWSILHAWGLPIVAAAWYLWLYWLTWIGWFVTGAVVSHPEFHPEVEKIR